MRSRHFTFAVLLALLSCFTVRAQDADRSHEHRVRSGTWTVHAGLGSSRAWNFLGLSKDFRRTEHLSFYASAGLGTILVGAGAAYYSRRVGNGIVLSATAGLAGAHASAVYQLRLGESSYLVAGGSYGAYFLQYEGALPVIAFEKRF